MSYIALYRKYRPQLFKDVQGQKYVIQTLLNSIKNQSVSHAYIFSGPKGIGKTTIAKIFAKALNCLNHNEGDACNQCEICQLIINQNSTDIIELDAASNNGVDEIRQINDSVGFLPTALRRKIYIIDEAHMLTNSAWNALLKTIEEPPAHVVFIFATTEAYKIPPTILSRCQYFEFSKIKDNDLMELINTVSKLEKIKIEEDAKNKIITLADGSARDALSMLEQLALYTKNEITLKSIDEVFGLLDLDHKINFINLIINNELGEIIDQIEKFNQLGINFSQLALDLTKMLIDKLLYMKTKSLKNLKILSLENSDKIIASEVDLIKMINIWQETYLKLKTSSDTIFYFQNAIFKILESINLPPEVAPKISSEISKKNDDNNSDQSLALVMSEDELEKQLNDLPPIDSVFKINLRKNKIDKNVSKKVETSAVEPIAININSEDKISPSSIEEIFMQVSFNYHQENKKKLFEYITNIQNNIGENPKLTCYADVIKVLVVSHNGGILLVEDEVDAELFNKQIIDNDALKDLRDYFGNPLYLVAITSQQYGELVKKYKINRLEQKEFSDVSLDKINLLIKNDNSILSLASELFQKK